MKGDWKEECRGCRHFRATHGGRLWRCRVRVRPALYCAEARIKGLCRYEPRSAGLNREQLSGCACIVCGRTDRPMEPIMVETEWSTMVFRCAAPECECSEERAREMVAVSGKEGAGVDNG